MVNFPIPVIRGRIARRLLVNYRADPYLVAALLPEPFRPKLVSGFALIGICLIRLEEIRPRGLPSAIGLSSENAAHRIAVEWTEQGMVREGVFVQRRHSSSAINCVLGGRIFPGVHERASFTVADDGQRVALRLEGRDDGTRVEVSGRRATALPAGSVFRSLEEASEFSKVVRLAGRPPRGVAVATAWNCGAQRGRPRRSRWKRPDLASLRTHVCFPLEAWSLTAPW